MATERFIIVDPANRQHWTGREFVGGQRRGEQPAYFNDEKGAQAVLDAMVKKGRTPVVRKESEHDESFYDEMNQQEPEGGTQTQTGSTNDQ